MIEPIFVVTHGPHVYEIFVDGSTTGFPEGSATINRIPQRLYQERTLGWIAGEASVNGEEVAQ